jgi:hypothetical protein
MAIYPAESTPPKSISWTDYTENPTKNKAGKLGDVRGCTSRLCLDLF